jgi:hypothetical protein
MFFVVHIHWHPYIYIFVCVQLESLGILICSSERKFYFYIYFHKKTFRLLKFLGISSLGNKNHEADRYQKISTLALFSRSKDTSFVNMAAGANEDVRNFSYSFLLYL